MAHDLECHYTHYAWQNKIKHHKYQTLLKSADQSQKLAITNVNHYRKNDSLPLLSHHTNRTRTYANISNNCTHLSNEWNSFMQQMTEMEVNRARWDHKHFYETCSRKHHRISNSKRSETHMNNYRCTGGVYGASWAKRGIRAYQGCKDLRLGIARFGGETPGCLSHLTQPPQPQHHALFFESSIYKLSLRVLLYWPSRQVIKRPKDARSNDATSVTPVTDTCNIKTV